MNTEKLISLKENFTGQKFQWIKTDRADLLGKVVTCRDINPLDNGSFVAIFDDGSKIDAARLNSNLLMLHGDMPPLTKAEVESINANSRPTSVKKPQPGVQNTQAFTQPTTATTFSQDLPPVTQPSAQPQAKTNMFSNFNSEETQFNLSINIKLPDRKLLKMMYANAENKEKFLSELSEYLHSGISKKTVRDSIESILAPSQVRKEVRPIINLKEVNESR